MLLSDGDNFRKPKPLKKVHGVLDKINVVLPPSIEKFEEDLCQLVNADRMAKVSDGKYVVFYSTKCGLSHWWNQGEKQQGPWPHTKVGQKITPRKVVE